MELSVHNIHKRFKEKQVLKGISFSAQSGQALGYLGRNGAGKTTTIRILTDIFKPDEGEIFFDGKPMDFKNVRLGYLPEERGLYPKVKVSEQMVYIGRLRGMDAASAKKKALILLDELEASEYWHKKLETLSKGNQQKIQLAIAVLHDPDVIILDEPFTGLDPVNAQILKNLISKEAKKGKIVLFSSHQMSYVEEFCSHICIINDGGIVVNGKINDIKKTYTRNCVSIMPEAGLSVFEKLKNRPEWETITQSAAADGDTIKVTLKDERQKPVLLKLLMENEINIDRFSVVEPTLQEIFVEKAGGAE